MFFDNSTIAILQGSQIVISDSYELLLLSRVYSCFYLLGLLSAPSAVNVETTQSTILLTWTPPFSLINITTYVVTITDEESADVTSRNTSMPYFRKINHEYCRRFNLTFEIAAANPVGVGNRTAPINASFHRRELTAAKLIFLLLLIKLIKFINFDNLYSFCGSGSFKPHFCC